MYSAHFRINGHVIKRSLKTKDQAVAKRKLRDLRAEAGTVDLKAADDTVGQIATRHFDTEKGRLARSSITKKRSMLKSVMTSWPGGSSTKARDVKASDVEQWLNASTKGKRVATRNEWLFFVKGMFDRAVLDGVISRSPAAHLNAKRRESVERLTPDVQQFQAIVDHVRANSANRSHLASADFIEFLGLSGLGKAEAANLKRQDVDTKKGKIFVTRCKTSTGFWIPIFPQLRPLVDRLLDQADGDPSAKLLGISESKKSLDSACRALGFEHYTHISLRRMFITNAIERGVDVRTIAEWQGHRDGGKLILDTYSHVRHPHNAAMAKLLTASAPPSGIAHAGTDS